MDRDFNPLQPFKLPRFCYELTARRRAVDEFLWQHAGNLIRAFACVARRQAKSALAANRLTVTVERLVGGLLGDGAIHRAQPQTSRRGQSACPPPPYYEVKTRLPMVSSPRNIGPYRSRPRSVQGSDPPTSWLAPQRGATAIVLGKNLTLGFCPVLRFLVEHGQE